MQSDWTGSDQITNPKIQTAITKLQYSAVRVRGDVLWQ